MKCKEQVQINPLCVTANGNILASGNLCFKVFKLQLRGCLNEKKRPVYSPANRVPRLTGMILIFVSWDAIYHKSTPSKTHFFLYLCYRRLLSLLSPYYFHCSIHHFCLYEIFYCFYEILLNQLINLTSVSITLFVECFSVSF